MKSPRCGASVVVPKRTKEQDAAYDQLVVALQDISDASTTMRLIVPDDMRSRTEELDALDFLGRAIGRHCAEARARAEELFGRAP